MVGTPAWCALDDDDPAKLAALLDAAQHHALRVEIAQEARADASKVIEAAEDWPTISRKVKAHNNFQAAHPWAKRVTA
jgi:organic hydroperoxide reductase OsmC/OhrA